MSDHGGHGGASESEVLVPAVFISPQFSKFVCLNWSYGPDNTVKVMSSQSVNLTLFLGMHSPLNG